jgi:hypothetical protein
MEEQQNKLVMKEKIKVLHNQLRETVQFEELGFQDFEKDILFYNWKLKRDKGEKTDIVSYSFSKDKWNYEMFLHPINSFIVFEKLNKILLSVDKSNLFNCYLLEPTLIELPNFDKKNTKNYYDIAKLQFIKDRIFNEQIFEEALALFQEQLKSTALPFFDKIQTLQQVNDEILEKYEQREWTKYIFKETMFKALIIMKLCNNTDKYYEVSKSHKEIIANAIQEGHTQYQERYDTLIKLLDFLESGKYLEVI